MTSVLSDYERENLTKIPMKDRDILWDEILKKKYGEVRNTCSLPREEYLECVRYILNQFYFAARPV